MKNKKYISQKNLIRLLLFVSVIAVAFIFDHLNNNEVFSLNESKEIPTTNTVSLGQNFFYNPVKTSELNPGNKLSSRKLFLRTQEKFVLQYHNSRSFHISKSEPVLINSSDFLSMHLVLIKQIHYINPDDTPPLS